MANTAISMYEMIDRIVEEAAEDTVAEEAIGFFNNIDDWDKHTSSVDRYVDSKRTASLTEVRMLYRLYKEEWKALRKMYSKPQLEHDLELQKKVLWAEKKLLQNTINAIDQLEENAYMNIAVFSGILSITLFLSASALIIPESASPALIGAAHVGKCIGDFYLVLKLMGMMVKYSDNTSTVLRSQKTTGVLSKQLLTAKLRHQMSKIDAKLQYVLAKKLLDTNSTTLQAMQKYNEAYLDRFMSNADKMQNDLAKNMIDNANRYFPKDRSQNTNSLKNDPDYKKNDKSDKDSKDRQKGVNGFYDINGGWHKMSNPEKREGGSGHTMKNGKWKWFTEDKNRNMQLMTN